MNTSILIAVTWFGQEHRVLGLDWNYLVIIGLIGNATFSMRFLVQWLASERRGESVIPVQFWYWSIGGSLINFLFFFFLGGPGGVVAYFTQSVIFLTDLMQISEHKDASYARDAFSHA